MRWLATILAIAAAGLFILFLGDGEKAEVQFPVHLKGRVALWTVAGAFVFWAAIALTNWMHWFRSRKR